MSNIAGWSWPRAGVVALLSAAAITVPADLIDTPLFTRMTPVRSWDYLLAALAVALATVAAGLGRLVNGPDRGGCRTPAPGGSRVGTSPVAAATMVALAVGCPLCNKLVLAALGAGGALAIWAPAQPVLGALSVLGLAFIVVVRWRAALAGCGAGTVASDKGDEGVENRPSGMHDSTRTGSVI